MKAKHTVRNVIAVLKRKGSKRNVAGMARFGINPNKTLGVSVPTLRSLAKEIGTDHVLAAALWKTGIHEARMLAGFIDDPEQVRPAQMDAWAAAFDSWDVCDQVCCNLFDRTPYAWATAVRWSASKKEFVRRAGFSLMAGLAWHRRDAKDRQFLPFFRCIEAAADDERNFVKKAVNWALRQIGKRNPALGKQAMRVALRLSKSTDPSSRWIGLDAVREFRAKKIG